MDLTLLHKYRAISDGLSIIEFDCNFDWYDGDHCPKFNLSLRILNCTMFELNVYNMHHSDELDDAMSDIQRQCWQNGAQTTSEDFDADDRAFIEKVSGIVANEGSKSRLTTN